MCTFPKEQLKNARRQKSVASSFFVIETIESSSHFFVRRNYEKFERKSVAFELFEFVLAPEVSISKSSGLATVILLCE